MIAYTVSLAGKVVYVGICLKPNPHRRWRRHQSDAAKGSKLYLHEAIRKTGAEHFSVEAIASAKSWKDLCEIERILIAQHDTYFWLGAGYNMTLGGDGAHGARQSRTSIELAASKKRGRKHTAERRRRNSEAQKARVRTPEEIAYQNDILRRNAVALRGRKVSEEIIARIRAANVGKIMSPETRRLLSVANTGKKRSAASVAASAAGIRGVKRPAWVIEKIAAKLRGRTISDERKRNIGALRARKVWATNGERNHLVLPTEVPAEGWRFGKTQLNGYIAWNKGAVGERWITDGTHNKFLKPETPIPAGWRLGRSLTPEHRANLSAATWITNGVQNRKVVDNAILEDGWRRGRSITPDISEETRAKMREARRLRAPVSEETRAKMSAAATAREQKRRTAPHSSNQPELSL